jgi:hypothetical protein
MEGWKINKTKGKSDSQSSKHESGASRQGKHTASCKSVKFQPP